MNWMPDDRYSAGHIKATTSRGEYMAGPRKSDGFWEYATPECEGFGDHKQHLFDNLTETQAKDACELHSKGRD